jgi:acetamidase/formamidase
MTPGVEAILPVALRGRALAVGDLLAVARRQ